MSAGARLALAIAALSTTTFLTVFDGQVVAVALPAIERSLALRPVDAQWAITAYTVPLAGLLLLAGRVGDLIGQRRALLLGLSLFAGGLVGAGLASGGMALFGFRVVQGAGAALAIPASFAQIGARFDDRWRPRAFAVASVSGSVAAVVGAPLSGLVVATAGWPWIFFLSVPLAVAALAVSRMVLEEVRSGEDGRRLDVLGAALVTLGLATLVLGLTDIRRYGLTAPATAVTLAVAAALLAAFGVRQRTAALPLIAVSLLRSRPLLSGMVGMFGVDFSFNAVFLIDLLRLQQAERLSPATAGLAIAPLGLAAAVGGPLSARLLRRWNGAFVAAAGLGLTAAGLLGIAFTPTALGYAASQLPGLLAAGLGIAAADVALIERATIDVPPPSKGLAFGMFQVPTHVGGAVSVAALTTVSSLGPVAGGAVSGFALAFAIGAGTAAAAAFALLAIGAPFLWRIAL